MKKDLSAKVFPGFMAEQEYYLFQIGDWRLIGTTPKEIINTMDYYTNERKLENARVPSDSEILKLKGDIYVTCAFPLVHVDHHFDAKVRDRIIFDVYENALDYVKDLARTYETFKRGDLFYVKTLPMLGYYFLPEYAMQGVREYDWSQHDQQVSQWLGHTEGILQGAEQAGVLRRAKTVRQEIDDMFGAAGTGHQN